MFLRLIFMLLCFHGTDTERWVRGHSGWVKTLSLYPYKMKVKIRIGPRKKKIKLLKPEISVIFPITFFVIGLRRIDC